MNKTGNKTLQTLQLVSCILMMIEIVLTLKNISRNINEIKAQKTAEMIEKTHKKDAPYISEPMGKTTIH